MIDFKSLINNLKNILIVLVHIIIIIFSLSILFFLLIQIKVIYTIGSISNVNVNHLLQNTSNLIGFSSIFLGLFSVLIAGLGFFTYKQYQRTTIIRQEAETIFNNKLIELKRIQQHHLLTHFIFFIDILNTVLVSNQDAINSIELIKNKDENNYIYILKDMFNDQFSEIRDTIEHLKNLMFRDKEKIKSALFFIRGKEKLTFIIFIDQFISLRENEDGFKDLVELAKIIKEELGNSFYSPF